MQTDNIDAIITWVNGNDPNHIAKRNAYTTGKKENLLPDVGGNERFIASGEIFICIGSILRFAPFIRKIFIITDNQNPCLDEFIRKNFPDTKTGIEIIDHKVIFKGYEECLPTFSSRSIETMVYRIPGLSEKFVYFNDDFFLTAPIKENIWFKDNKAVCYADKFSCTITKILSLLKTIKNGRRTVGFKDGMMNAARIVGSKYFWLIGHAPLPMKKSILEDFYNKNENILTSNIKYRFRNGNQYNPQALFYILAERQGECIFLPPSKKILFLKPKAKYKHYISKRIKNNDHNKELLFGCINSLNQASNEEKKVFWEWISGRLNVEFPITLLH